ncbi:type II toxin-antitoxin system VapB family antitoxin [Glycomyces sp. A-F 0318]|uniref:type II toxin-antitoxin system VapB family antitoxin n=1 Tax=Glycomyces amatae TaxID=2881355 RepID=UPI001E5FD2D3|nr:type II toxin-antitoxin system VapB family antitoxin [Glycomyces amatae]MCD0442466.1 type II toxin-antitoxin system VapB family antitoxin [Glycomyces amatae]
MPDLEIIGVSEATLALLRDRASARSQPLEEYLRELLEREARTMVREQAARTPHGAERAKAALARLRRMADEGLLDFDRMVDLNKSVDDGLLRYAMKVLDVDSRTEAINRALEEAVVARGAEQYRVTDQEA